MNNFTISQLAQYSGVKAPTIRMWEQRHNALRPYRTEGNTRYYDNQQLRRLLNIVSLQENGKKISELSAKTDQELFDLLKQQQPYSSPSVTDFPNPRFFITQLLASGVTYDSHHFEKILAHCFLRFGMKRTYTEIIYPMLMRIGLMWTTDELPPAQEHFITNLLRQKLYTAIDSLPPAPADASSWLLFLPENEFHEIGLLMSDYLLKLSGKKTLYLGPNVPLSSVVAAEESWPSENLLLFMVHRDTPGSIENYLLDLKELVPHARLILSCDPHLTKEVKYIPDLTLLHSLPDLENLLEVEPSLNSY